MDQTRRNVLGLITSEVVRRLKFSKSHDDSDPSLKCMARYVNREINGVFC